MRVVFFGTAELASVSLAALAREDSLRPVAVVTQPDRPKGRELKLAPSPVKELACQLGLPTLQPDRARNPDFLATFRDLEPELVLVAAYGQLLPPAVLDVPQYGCLNVHASLLPKFRGAAPIQWAILAGEAETGVTIMKMDPGLDTGDILTQRATEITANDDSQTLHDRLARLGGELLLETIPGYVTGSLKPSKQPVEGMTYARKISKEDGLLDWTLDARNLWNRVRAFTPWPGAFSFIAGPSKPVMLKIWRAEVVKNCSAAPGTVVQADAENLVVACGEGGLRLVEVQREGGRRLATAAFLAGHPLAVGTRLFSPHPPSGS